MANNIFEKMTEEERTLVWMYMIFNKDKIIEKTEQWTKEAEKAGMTLTEYLESINPLDDKIASDYLNDCESELDMIEVFAVAKELLEQEPILDKIRAEIMSLTDGDTPERIWNVDVLEIIDKYKSKEA